LVDLIDFDITASRTLIKYVMINKKIISDSDGKGYTIAISHEDFERVNPIQYFKDAEIFRSTTLYTDLFLSQDPNFPKDVLDKVVSEHAEKDWENRYDKIVNTPIPAALISLLSAPQKADQIKLLKGIQLKPFLIAAFICKAYTEHGFTYSKIRGGIFQQELNMKTYQN
jgi:hypothetical protein